MLDALITKRPDQHYLAPNLKELWELTQQKQINSEKLPSI